MEQIAQWRVFGGKGAFADASGVGLDDPHDAVDPVRGDAGAGAGTAGGGVGAGDVRVGPVINVQEGSLSPFKEDLFAAADGFVEIDHGVADEWPKLFSGRAEVPVDAFKVEGFDAESGEHRVVFLNALGELFAEQIGLEEVGHAQPDAGDFVAVSGTNSTFGGADFTGASGQFAGLIEFTVVGQDKVGGVANEEVGGRNGDVFGAESFDFAGQGDGVEDDAVADDADGGGAEDAGGDEVEDVFGAADDDGVTGIVAALTADDDLGFLSEKIDDLALAFIAPLGAYEDGISHG